MPKPHQSRKEKFLNNSELDSSSLKIITFPLGDMYANCHILVNLQNNKCIIVDPGDASDFISEYLVRCDYKPILIICTHGHSDHSDAVKELQMIFDIPFFMDTKDKFLLRQSKYVLVETKLKENNIIENDVCNLKLLSTPGHTPGSICYLNEENNVIFTGDLIFPDGSIGRYDYRYSNIEILNESISIILRLSPDLHVYPGHGESFILDEFKKNYSKNIVY